MTADREKWLAELKDGDVVAIKTADWSRSVLIQKVDRTTKTLIFCGPRTFNRKRGYAPGEGYNKSSIWPVTDQLMEQARHQKLAAWFASLKPTIEQLDAMKQACDAMLKERER